MQSDVLPTWPRRRLFGIGMAAAGLAALGACTSGQPGEQTGLPTAIRNRPRPMPSVDVPVINSLLTERNWINYNPGAPFDLYALATRRPGAQGASENQLITELTTLHNAGLRGLVTNAMAFGLERAPQIAKQIGFRYVVAKLWWQDSELLAQEKANLDKAIDAVDAICVGNEVIEKGITDLDGLRREVDDIRNRYRRPVTTGFQPEDWQIHPELATNIGDFSFLNMHPWWQLLRNDPITAAAWSAEAYDCIANTPGISPNRALIVQETGFPSGVESSLYWAPGATPQNQKRFYEALLATSVPFVWFLSSDSVSNRTNSAVSGYGGLWDENWKPKPVVDLLG